MTGHVVSLNRNELAVLGVALLFYSCVAIVCLSAAAPDDFVVNGSFEVGNFSTPKSAGNFMNIPAPSDYIPGWYVAYGSVDWARSRWVASYDRSPSCVDLNGNDAGTITTALADGLQTNTAYMVSFDAGANPESGAEIIANFTLIVLDNVTLNVLNSSVFGINTTEFYISGWTRFSGLLFYVLENHGVNLTFQSLIDGGFGPLLDNVRVQQASGSATSSPNSTAVPAPTSAVSPVPSHRLGGGKVASIAVAVALLLGSSLTICAFWRRKKRAGGSADRQPNIPTLKSYKLKEVGEMTNGFRNELARGGQGVVYRAVLPDGGKAAVKRVRRSSLASIPEDSKAIRSLRTELELLARLHHRNVVSLLGFCIDGDEVLLLYEFMENGTLAEHIHDSEKVMPWSERLRISLEVAQGLEYLHSFAQPPLVHRDIKSSNILLDQNMKTKVADFGLSKEITAKGSRLLSMFTEAKGTVGYIDPEYARNFSLTEKSDVYSYGVLLLEILTGRDVIDVERVNIVDWFKDWEVMKDCRKLWDWRLNRENCSLLQLRALSSIAGACVSGNREERPSMGEVVRSLHQAFTCEREKFFSKEGDGLIERASW